MAVNDWMRSRGHSEQHPSAAEQLLGHIQVDSWLSKERAQFDLLARLTENRPARSLAPYFAQVYSQNGEDGHIAEIFDRIGAGQRTFLEIGIEDGTQNTSRFLLEQGWHGTWVEGSPEMADRAAEIFADHVRSGALTVVQGFVTAENVNDLLDANGVPATLDYLSLDVDQNTSHVWRTLNRRARAMCIEYNANIPPSLALEVPYDPNAAWDGSSNYGASLKTLELIGRQKGAQLVGCDLSGVNAFFVDAAETADRFLEPFDARTHYEPPRYALMDQLGHPPSPTARTWVTPPEGDS
ncbi:hypothetical protein [Chachezhania sediminis]|uniref:hypothetical protein n=1 Tax=Chachezhania sediminis TaxID=2599291 RepID=UPI00131EC66E|nr:hypothetical protein [Chachezhania sediminis]